MESTKDHAMKLLTKKLDSIMDITYLEIENVGELQSKRRQRPWE